MVFPCLLGFFIIIFYNGLVLPNVLIPIFTPAALVPVQIKWKKNMSVSPVCCTVLLSLGFFPFFSCNFKKCNLVAGGKRGFKKKTTKKMKKKGKIMYQVKKGRLTLV